VDVFITRLLNIFYEGAISVINPYDKYKINAVNTATKEELTLMLYDGALRFCNQALSSMEEKDHMKTNELICKVQDIVQEFRITLDKKHDIANQLDQLYDYLNYRLLEANLKKDSTMLAEVRDHMRSLRDTWKEAMKLAKQAPAKPAAGQA
jgi:flagellar protein FliS